MKISFENPDKINGLLTLTVEEADYKDNVEKTLKDYRKKANFPGFRPGMVPMGLIKKQFGASAKMDAINKLVGEQINQYIQEHHIQMLGEPLPSQTQAPQDLEKPAPYTFAFDIAVAPEFKIELGKEDKVDYYKITVDDKLIDDQIDMLSSRNGSYENVETYEGNDLMKGDLHELDENGNKKPFERFLNDVQKINGTYNANYLHAEYNFVQASATMAAKWEQFSEDGDRYYLQYRTAKDDKVRPEHAALDGVTLPMSDSFWETYFPPNGWSCRCTVVQVRKQKYPATEHAEAMSRGEEAMNGERYNIFRFNSGKQGKTMPDYNPYTIKRCNDCDVAKGKLKLGFVPDYQLCQGCIMIRKCNEVRNRDNSAKATKKSPEVKKLQGTTISNPDFNHEVLVTGGSIREWTNQPHKEYAAKNSILKHIAKVFRESNYIGVVDNFKQKPGVIQSHLFETTVLGDVSWIVIREYDDGRFILHYYCPLNIQT